MRQTNILTNINQRPMNERIKALRTYLLDKKQYACRRTASELGLDKMSDFFAGENMPPIERSALCFAMLLNAETPVILPGEHIVFTRTVSELPDIFTQAEWAQIKKVHYIHERGAVCNISSDYETTLRVGLEARKEAVRQKLSEVSLLDAHLQSGLDNSVSQDAQETFLQSILTSIEAIQTLIKRYELHARGMGEKETAEVLKSIRTKGARSFREALQLLRILHFSIWEASNYHNTLGRFDQYMYPYYKNDIEKGVLTQEEAFDLLEEFFLVCNKDSDLYPGMQQGDNGQSLVLGGRDMQGNYLFNELSEMCLRASYELELIDPKINIRVDKDTPDEVFELGSQLTKKGLGFPQYSNDDIVIPGLIRKGYEPADAHEYVVAACWEFIIPKCGMDIPNIDAISLVGCVTTCLPKLNECPDYASFYRLVEREISCRMDAICEKHRHLYMIPAPVMSVLMEGTIEQAQDISLGSKYNNYGIHGTGIASAVDSLAAIKKYYFETGQVDYHTLLHALETDFEGETALREMLRTEAPKMGQDNDDTDDIATRLLDSFDAALSGRVNERGGVYRAGTGTAMYYVFHATQLGATPDGRSAGEMIPANYSPSLFIKQKGPVSVIKSFAKPNLVNVINGGPLTLEFDQSIFKQAESVQKLGLLVKTFVTLGGHQLQLNTVNKNDLLEAKKHPDKYRHLIVRVWGWSGYFVELDECYQDHVIQRIEFGL